MIFSNDNNNDMELNNKSSRGNIALIDNINDNMYMLDFYYYDDDNTKVELPHLRRLIGGAYGDSATLYHLPVDCFMRVTPISDNNNSIQISYSDITSNVGTGDGWITVSADDADNYVYDVGNYIVLTANNVINIHIPYKLAKLNLLTGLVYRFQIILSSKYPTDSDGKMYMQLLTADNVRLFNLIPTSTMYRKYLILSNIYVYDSRCYIESKNCLKSFLT